MKHNQHILLAPSDYPLIASPTLAKAYGVAAATFLQKLHYCLEKSDAQVHKGKKYWFHSYEQWQQTLGIYSVSTIKRIVAKLKQAEILVIKKLSKNKWLQTNFYSINYRKLKQLIQPNTETQAQPQSSTQTAKTTDSKSISSVHPAEDTQADTLTLSIQQAFHTLKDQAITHEQSLKSEKCSAQPNLVISEHTTAQGLSQPLSPIATSEILKNMNTDYRHFYQALLQQRVDIHYADQRIQNLLKQQKHVIRHIAYIKQSFCGQERYQWHPLEQLQIDSYLIK
jgi:lipopolysaccharide export LptBFGC system permease protein LptF